MRRTMSSTEAKTTARPVWLNSAGEAAECLMTAPPGARLPRSTAMPPVGFTGLAALRMMLWFGTSSAASATSPMVRPSMVGAERSRWSPSSFISFGTPPAQWKCSM